MATIEQRTEGTWQVRIRKKGYPATVKTFLNKRDAESWARMTESEMERGLWRDTTKAESTTLADAIRRYMAEVTSKKRSIESESSTMRVWLATPLAKLSLARITSEDIAKLRDEWMKSYAPATVVRRMTPIAHLFVTAKKEWGLTTLVSPFDSVKKPAVSNERTRRVSEDEIVRICAATKSVVLPSVIKLAVETAMRRGEMTKIIWKNVDLKSRTVYLPKTITKNGFERTVPLSTAAIVVLSGLPRNINGRVFSIRADAVTQAFDRAVLRARASYEKECEEQGSEPDTDFLVDLHPHDLRHEATTRLADKFAMHELAKITGHRDTRMLLRYYHPSAEDFAKRLA